MKRVLSSVILSCTLATAVAQDAPTPEAEGEGAYVRVMQNVEKLLSSFEGLSDWDTHYALMMDSLEKVYARNGWESESDAFSLSTAREVSAIPPWFPQQRFDKAVEIISDRYLLDDRQEKLLRETMIREASGVFMRNSGRIVQYAVEAIQTRAAGQPFTPEQVARWVELADPVFDDARQRANEAAKGLATELDPDQRGLLLTDLAAANRRMDDIHKMSRRWARGEWQPSDWGMEEDPIQLGGATHSKRAGGASSGQAQRQPSANVTPRERPPEATSARRRPSELRRRSALPPTSKAPPAGKGQPKQARAETQEDNSPWAQYVRRFIQKYRLDDGQQTRAWKVYRDVSIRADSYRKRYGERIETARRRARASSDEAAKSKLRAVEAEQAAALERLFEQLKRRLDRLPTRTQRRGAEPKRPEQPTTSPSNRISAPETDGP